MKNNKYKRLVHGVGIYEPGKYKSNINGKHTKEYNVWKDMLRRCYSGKFHIKNPTYVNCMACKEWVYFQVFAEWFHQNFYSIEGERICLDKDVLVKGNEIYSPRTCIFVPTVINNLLIKNNRKRGKAFIDVDWHEPAKKWRAQCHNSKGIEVHLGLFDTQDEAFQVYKAFKEKVIMEVIESYSWSRRIEVQVNSH